LATVGKTIRDRIETTRKVRSNIAQSQISTIAVLLLTYFIALIVWRNGPPQMQQFLGTRMGSALAAGSMVLQAVGIVWMALLSRLKF
jgi:Flp pilus assembly protein TadB